jgi:hypothetical protein
MFGGYASHWVADRRLEPRSRELYAMLFAAAHAWVTAESLRSSGYGATAYDGQLPTVLGQPLFPYLDIHERS